MAWKIHRKGGIAIETGIVTGAVIGIEVDGIDRDLEIESDAILPFAENQ